MKRKIKCRRYGTPMKVYKEINNDFGSSAEHTFHPNECIHNIIIWDAIRTNPINISKTWPFESTRTRNVRCTLCGQVFTYYHLHNLKDQKTDIINQIQYRPHIYRT